MNYVRVHWFCILFNNLVRDVRSEAGLICVQMLKRHVEYGSVIPVLFRGENAGCRGKINHETFFAIKNAKYENGFVYFE